MKLKFFFLSVIIVLISSCQSTPKNIVYFQDLDEKTQQAINQLQANYEPKIKNNDILLITVSSPTPNQELVAQFNLPMTSYLTPGEKKSQASTVLQTYWVDKDGYINYPIIGRIKLGNLYLSEAINLITNEVREYISDPIVNVEIMSFTVTVLGEVLTPGPVEVKNGRMSILDAIGAASDLTIYGNRKNVLLIRDNNGKKEFARFDLTKSDIFSSPYFYMQQNDVLVIEPNEEKQKESKHGEAKSYNFSVVTSIVSLAVGTASMIATLLIATK